MFFSTLRYFYPDLKQEEMRKFSLLSLIFFFSIGTYWLLRLLKNTIFYKIAFPEALGWAAGYGRLLQPTAKFWSPLVVFIIVIFYSKLVDMFKKHTLFYIIYSFYALLFGFMSCALIARSLYGDAFLGKYILASVGWISYFCIESFGSLNAALFWSFTNSITDSNSAKRGYPLIIAGAQIGAIGGSALLFFSHKIGIWALMTLATLFTAVIPFIVRYFMATTPASELVGNVQAFKEEKAHDAGKETKSSGGMLAGLRLLATRPYLFGIFMVSTIYEVISQIIDYLLQSQADIAPQFAGELGNAFFQGIYGVSTNLLSFLVALLGTSYMIKRFGLRFGLLLYPIVLSIAFLALLLYFLSGLPTVFQLLWATFAVMIIAKALGYAVNNPVKEMMYIPTSKDVKYKTKGFTDMFGGRMAKMAGSRINDMFKHSLADLMTFGAAYSMGLSLVWILAAIYVGRKNAQLIKNNEIVD